MIHNAQECVTQWDEETRKWVVRNHHFDPAVCLKCGLPVMHIYALMRIATQTQQLNMNVCDWEEISN